VSFSSSDPFPGVLPSDYTFTTSDKGTHVFGATLFTAGPQTLNVQDKANGSVTGIAKIAVFAAPASHFVLTAPPTTLSGMPFVVTVTALDAYGNTDTNYLGSLTFGSTDPYPALLPADYRFRPIDKGTHSFTGVTLFTAGAQTLLAQDQANGSITGRAKIAVVAAPANHFVVSAPPTAVSGTPFDVTVTALDLYGNTDTNYVGTVTFSSSDTDLGVILPADYTFQSTDSGVHTFAAGFTLITPGDQTLTAIDTVSGIAGGATVTVSTPAAPPGGGSRRQLTPNTNAVTPTQQTASLDRFFAFFRQENSFFEAMQSSVEACLNFCERSVQRGRAEGGASSLGG
jgi:hypothetical protein